MSDKINIEIVYALPHEQVLFKAQAALGVTASEAIKLSGVLKEYPEIGLAKYKLGIYGRLGKADVELRDGDRIEIYRPLLADPKEVCRKRAVKGRTMKQGGGEAAA